jgi:hypothetical protein
MILDDEDILIQSAIDSAHYEMVDLGLSVKWANKNVGASSPEDAGLYFQWGDTIGYTEDQVGRDKVFDKHSYPKYLNAKYNLTNGLKVLESIDDAATAYMGSQYRMPTIEEVNELINNTTQTFIDVGGNEYSKEQTQKRVIKSKKLKGVRFTGLNGNSIFIPAAGSYLESLLSGIGMYGILWSSSLYDGDDDSARYLIFSYDGNVSESGYVRFYGLSVRGVEFKL